MTRRILRVLAALAVLIAPALLPLAAPALAAISCPSSQWAGAYYADMTLSGAPVGQRCDTAIDFDWSAAGPGIGGISTEGYSARWTQTASFVDGTYTFTATADDGVRVLVDGATVIDGWRDQGATTYTATPTLSAGSHTIELDYYQNGGDAVVHFVYAAPAPPAPDCPAAGWTASYYDNTTLSGTPWVQCETSLDHDWGTTGPQGLGVGASNFSVRWSKTDTFVAGALNLSVTADDGMRVYVDGTLVIDNWVDEGPTQLDASPTVTAGGHTIVVEYYQHYGGAVASLTYGGQALPSSGCADGQWLASYYANTKLSGTQVAQQCEDVIDHDWGSGGPGLGGLGGTNYSVSWTKTPSLYGGPLTINAATDDGVRVLVDGTALIDHWIDEGVTPYSGSTTVIPGTHTITVQYFQHFGDASARVSYTGAPKPSCTTIQWDAAYYNNKTLTAPVTAERCENTVSNDWGTNGPSVSGIGGYNFSGRWSRTDNFAAGRTTITVTADDGVRAYLDGSIVIDHWVDEGPTTYTATVPVSAGAHTVTVEYYQGGGGAVLRASYTGGGAPGPLPPDPPGGCTSDCAGSWQVMSYQSPVRSIHSTLMHTGNVLLVAGSGNDGTAFQAGSFKATVWNPTTGTFTDVPTPADLFCTGHVQLPDGRVLLGGGTLNYPTATANYEGLANSYIFDPTTATYTRVNDMPGGGHWYPSLVELGTGDVYATGGLNETGSGNVSTEMFDSSAGSWLPLSKVTQPYFYWGLYPQMILMSDGRLFYSGEHTFGRALADTSGSEIYDINTGTITDVPGLREIDNRDQGAAVLLPPAQAQKVMDFAGGNSYSGLPPIAETDIIDLTSPMPTWAAGPDLLAAKMYVSAVILPDGKVLETGGASSNRAGPVHEASIYDPVANTITPVAADPQDRMYHSEAYLLPDGRVAAIGNNPADGSFSLGISIYSPWYMSVPRPTITSAASQFDYGSTQSVGVTGTIKRATLIHPASVTHSSDPNQRSVDLPVTGTGSTISLAVPNNPNLLPPGYYMLFVQDASGAPSVAKWVHVA